MAIPQKKNYSIANCDSGEMNAEWIMKGEFVGLFFIGSGPRAVTSQQVRVNWMAVNQPFSGGPQGSILSWTGVNVGIILVGSEGGEFRVKLSENQVKFIVVWWIAGALPCSFSEIKKRICWGR